VDKSSIWIIADKYIIIQITMRRNTLNNIHLIGRVGFKEVKNTEKCKVLRLSIAVDDYYKNEKNTMWISVEAFGEKAEKYEDLKIGSTIYVRGKLRIEEYADKNGNKRKLSKILADSIIRLSSKKIEGENEPQTIASQIDELRKAMGL